MSTVYDVAVIGAGVVGAAIARELAGFDLKIALVEAKADVGDSTSKANTAILHTGFDATPGTLESRLVRRGYELLTAYSAQAGIPVERTGAVMVAWTEEELARLPALQDKAVANGYADCALIDAAEVYARVPVLGPGALGGLTVPGESITCPWTTSLALATDAVQRGASLLLEHPVISVERTGGTTRLAGTAGEVCARWVVNAAGLGCDLIDALFGYARFTVTARRGELLVYDKQARALLDTVVLPVPSKLGKGVLVSPTIYGNVMLGPTAQELPNRTDTATSEDGFAFLLAKGARLLPALLTEEVTASYAGLRAAIDRSDYLIELDAEQCYVLVGGIRSTGLTSSLAVAEYVRELLRSAGQRLAPRQDLPPAPAMPNLGEAFPRPYQRPELIADDPEYGRIVCFCERVSAGELRDALASPLPPRDLGGMRRRTRAVNGRCQGFFCGAAVAARLEAGGAV